MAKFPDVDDFIKSVVETSLDNYEYNGKTLKQWIDAIIEFEKKKENENEND